MSIHIAFFRISILHEVKQFVSAKLVYINVAR